MPNDSRLKYINRLSAALTHNANAMSQLIKTADEITCMADGGRILAAVLETLTRETREGVTLVELDRRAEELIRAAGAEPAFLGYKPHGAARPFPNTLCTSVNEVVVHGVPARRRLIAGDIVKLDLGVRYEGYFADAATTIAIGTVSEAAARLIDATRRALERGIRLARPGARLGDIGHVIEKTVKRAKFHVVRGLTGHGIGKELHEEPSVFNYGTPGTGLALISGMVLAIEVMTGERSGDIIQRPDESYATRDGSLSAHFEHTVAVTADGPRILTAI